MGAASSANVAKRSCTDRDATALLISALRRSSTADGVLAGAKTAIQVLASKSLYPNSATVGTSGNAGLRLREVTARARTLPDLTNCTAGGIDVDAMGTCPLTTALV